MENGLFTLRPAIKQYRRTITRILPTYEILHQVNRISEQVIVYKTQHLSTGSLQQSGYDALRIH